MHRFAVVGLIVCGLTSSLRADDAKAIERAKAQAQETGKATIAGDYKKLCDLTHPKLVELIGGRDKFQEVVKKGMEQMKAQGFAIKSYDIGAPGSLKVSGKSTFTLIPTTLVMTASQPKKATITVSSFLLAVSADGGSSWTFIDGNIPDDKVREVLPDFPADMKLPKRQPPKVEQED